ncbi:MAG TPA: hypothetical protein VJS42_04175 [Steroidobacteraceae bacterium]|nr:hypothetical protein [Steroidobacteraceae bacterium]
MSATTIPLSAQTAAGQKMSLLTNWIAFDPLRVAGRRTPRSWAVLCVSVLAGLAIIGLYRYGTRFHLHMPMFNKEGFLENLTFFLDGWAAALLTFAATRTYRHRTDGIDALIAAGYALCGALLFLVAMEEISWGQQLVTFQTPEAWRELNRQGETTLHNLASRDALTFAWKVVGVSFAVGVVALTALAHWGKQKLMLYIAPHPTLIPLAALTAYASVRVHPEIAEILIAIFFAFYGYRAYVASPSF